MSSTAQTPVDYVLSRRIYSGMLNLWLGVAFNFHCYFQPSTRGNMNACYHLLGL